MLHTHPAVGEAQNIGVPCEYYGERVAVWIRLKTEGSTARELFEFCGEKLSRYKILEYWKVVNEFPLTITGKVEKFVVRELLVEDLVMQNAGNDAGIHIIDMKSRK